MSITIWKFLREYFTNAGVSKISDYSRVWDSDDVFLRGKNTQKLKPERPCLPELSPFIQGLESTEVTSVYQRTQGNKDSCSKSSHSVFVQPRNKVNRICGEDASTCA